MSLSNLTNIESLPDELVFLILLELHGDEIYQSAQFVCRKWYHMIRTRHFTHTHLRHSTPGLLIKYFLRQNPDPTFLTLRGGGFETFKLGHEFTNFYWSTCNGLLLGIHPRGGCDLVIVNPATKQYLALPHCRDRGGDYTFSAIGYAPASMKYKLVRSNTKQGCAIFTVGVDSSWRHFDVQHISPIAWGFLYNSRPLIIEGLVYWTTQEGTSLLSLNLESEIFTEIHLPQGYEYGELEKYYLSTWSSLTLLVGSSSSRFSWDVWVLKKPETGEWKKLPNIDLEVHKCRVKQLPYAKFPPVKIYLVPVGWLNYGEVLVLRISRPTNVHLLYNVVTQETDFLELNQGQWFFPYKSSLVWFDGCS